MVFEPAHPLGAVSVDFRHLDLSDAQDAGDGSRKALLFSELEGWQLGFLVVVFLSLGFKRL